MSVKEIMLSVGFDKNGQADFAADLTYEQMKELRAMIPVAIGTLEQMWRDKQACKPENQPKQVSPCPPTLTELRELEKRATQGEWRAVDRLVFVPLFNRKYPEGQVRWCPSLTYEHQDAKRTNAEFIAATYAATYAIVNWFRSGALEELERERDALRKFYAAWKEIKQYGGRFTMDMA